MKNFSTGAARPLLVRGAAVAAMAACLAAAPVQAAESQAAESRAADSQAARIQAAAGCTFRPNAPDQHLVVKGDTLWDIAGTFLEHPWCWPQVWGMNRDEIRNPHWIYPGQIIYFDRARGRLSLTRPGQADPGAGLPPLVRLSPQLRTEDMGPGGAIPAIPAGAIEPYLTQPLVVEAHQLDATPRIAAAPEERSWLSEGDRAYVRGELHGATSFQVFRPGKELRDPDSGRVIAHEAAFVGAVRLVAEARPGVDVHTVVVTRSVREMGIGDRLLPAPPAPVRNYVPHAPLVPVRARVMAVPDDARNAVQSQVVAVNRGSLDGLDVGAVLRLYHLGQKVKDPASKGFLGFGKAAMRLPDEQYGELFIFRVFGRVSYGLIMQSTAPVQIGDVATSPE